MFLMVIVSFALGAMIVLLLRKKQGGGESLLLLQQQIGDLSRTLDARLGESSQALREQFGQSGEIMHRITKDVSDHLSKVTQELVRVGESSKQVVNIADQLKHLQDILKNPKQRGTLGEYHLEVALKNILPPAAYGLQYQFSDGTKVDAVIFYAEKIIPIDSKFSLENYMKILDSKTDVERAKYEDALKSDLKTRIEETSKYIKPGEGTMDFAFMFIPSEPLYYDLLVNKIGTGAGKSLLEYAVGEKHVHIVSPTTIYAYLETILHGLRQTAISKSAEQIKKNIGELATHLKKYEDYFQKLGNHLRTSASAYNNAYKEFKKIDKDVYRITGSSADLEDPLLVEGPEHSHENQPSETDYEA